MVSLSPGSNVGDILYWNGSAWTALVPGTEGLFLLTQGIGSAPEWGAVPSVEGDYEGWVKKWELLLPDAYLYGYETDVTIDEKNGLIYTVWLSLTYGEIFVIYNISDSSTVFHSGSGYTRSCPNMYWDKGGIQFGGAAWFETGGVSQSIQTYFLLARSTSVFEVWREGVKLQTLDIAADYGCCQSDAGLVSISGKYVAFFGIKSGFVDMYLLLYEGLSTVLDSGTSTSVVETTITDSTKTWTVDEWVGKWVKASSGNGQGYLALITSNGANTLVCSDGLFVTAGMVSSDEYKILDY